MDVFISSIAGYLQGLSATQPKLVAILAIAYIVGLVLKTLRSAVESFVLDTPGKDDDAKLAKIEASPAAKAVFFVMDLLIRFKKPGA